MNQNYHYALNPLEGKRQLNPTIRIMLPMFFLWILVIFSAQKGWGQMSIPNTSAQIQNFNGMGSSSTATLPTGFVVSQGTVYASGTTSTTQAAGTTGTGVLNGSSAGGTYNFANGITASATDRALGFLTSSGFTSPRSIMLELQNNTGSTITNLAITFDYEKYRSGSREFTWTFYSGTDGSTWTAQTAGDQPYEGDANNTTIYNPPTSTPKSVNISGLTIANGSKYYLRWTITGGGGSTNGQAIGIDNLSITATVCASQVTCYRDMDNDGYGNASNSQVFCMTCGTGYVSNNTDCIDTDASIHPGAMETCNGCDKDCDGFTGDDVAPIPCGTTMPPNCAGQQTCIQQAVPFPGACLPGGGTLTACNNNPQPEVCDGLDNDCNTVVDDNLPPTPCIPLGVPAGLVYGGTSQCRQGFYDCSLGLCVGFVGPSEEVCDGIDNDCDGVVDEGVPGAGLQCEPEPGIVYGGNSPCQLGIMTCVNGIFVCQGGIGPAPEICDGIDNDCDGVTDDGVQSAFYADSDMDGFGDPAVTQMACSQPSGYVTNNTDCNDGNAAINPSATEVCDAIDNNCNSMTDEGVGTVYYRDMDMDGFGNPAVSQQACSQPTGYVTNNTDCNDNNALEKPGQIWYKDIDGDGYAETGAPTINQCLRPVGYKVAAELTAISGDCNDGNAAINPSATEVCDGVDNNCNSMTDEGVGTVYYRDMDMDGFGNPAVTQMACSQPTGYVTNNTDCNDNDNAIYPGASEICDGKDNNCNGQTDEPQPLPAPWATTGIGETGSSVLAPCPAGAPQFVVNATGFSPNVNNDAVQVTYQTLCGNSSITVHITGISGGGWAGITMRESTATGSKMVALKTQLTNFVRREARSITNGPKSTQQIPGLPPPSWLRIQRSGNIFSFYTSTNGTTWSLVGTQTIAMSNCLLVGMFAESINVNTTTTATFDNVSVSGSGPVITLAGVDNSGLELQGELDFILYPNPTNGQLMIGFENAPTRLETVSCTVYNTQGQEVLERNIAVHGQAESIDLSSLANGVYWVRIQGDNMTPGIRRVIKVDEIRP